jgi:hypothetical protein
MIVVPRPVAAGGRVLAVDGLLRLGEDGEDLDV